MIPMVRPGDAGKSHHDVGGVAGLHFQEVAEVNHSGDYLANVVRLLHIRGHHLVESRIRIHIQVAFQPRRIFQIVGRQKAEQLLADQYGVAVIFGDEMDHAGVGHVGFGAAQLLGGYVLAGHAA